MSNANVFEALLASLQGSIDPKAQPYQLGGTRMNPKPTGPEFTPQMGATVMNPNAAPVDPESVMSVQPGFEEANMSIAPAVAAPTPPTLPPEQQAALVQAIAPVIAKSVGRREATSKGNGMQSLAGKPDDEFAMLLAKAGKVPGHGDQRDVMVADRDAKMAKSESERDLSDTEKIGMALIATLPALLGGIGGAAVAGGAGASAGVAGGLSGASAGINQIAAGKEAKRKEAKTDAEKISERIAHLDEQIAAEKEKASDRTLSMALQERSAQKAATLEDKKMQQSKLIADANNRTQLTAAMLHEKGAMDRAQIDAQVTTNKALMAAKQSGTELKDFQGKATQFATSMLVAKDDLDQMRDPTMWNTMTSWSGLQSALSDPKRQKYARSALNFIDAVTRDVSGAAITPSEWETKMRQYLPTLGSSPGDMENAQRFRDSALNTMLAKSGPGRDIAISSYQAVTQPQQQQQSASSSEDAAAVAWARQNPSDSRARKILDLHGIH